MNIELAKKVYQRIVSRPGLFDMNIWILPDTIAPNPFDYKNECCSTTACIAGWATILSEKYTLKDCNRSDVALLGAKELELTPKQMQCLFFEDDERKAIARLKKAIELAEIGQLKDDYILLDGETIEDIWDV